MAPEISEFKPMFPDSAVQDAGEPWAALQKSALPGSGAWSKRV